MRNKPPTRQDAQRAADTLGIATDLSDITLEEVKKRFRSIAREAHPDTGQKAKIGPVKILSKAIHAKQVLVGWLEANAANPDCPLCKGSGYTRYGRLWTSAPCPRCTLH